MDFILWIVIDKLSISTIVRCWMLDVFQPKCRFYHHGQSVRFLSLLASHFATNALHYRRSGRTDPCMSLGLAKASSWNSSQQQTCPQNLFGNLNLEH